MVNYCVRNHCVVKQYDGPMADPRWLTPDEQEAWLALAALTIRLPALLDSQLQHDDGLGLVEYLTLAMLSESTERTLPQATLARLTATPAPRMSRTLGRLEARGLVERAADPDDRRAVLARLTDDGLAAVVAAAPGHVSQVRAAVFDRLDAAQVDQLRDIARALTATGCAESDDCTGAADFAPRPTTR